MYMRERRAQACKRGRDNSHTHIHTQKKRRKKKGVGWGVGTKEENENQQTRTHARTAIFASTLHSSESSNFASVLNHTVNHT
mmetsp:Transcript_17493/g.43620  ORF Transcript_17493/g.43620 Transcript_17493/m.43620 type:complete len:82 (-) Transcript_17493:11-256(-)